MYCTTNCLALLPTSRLKISSEKSTAVEHARRHEIIVVVPRSGKLYTEYIIRLDVEHSRRHYVVTVVQQNKWETSSMQKKQTILHYFGKNPVLLLLNSHKHVTWT